jgi:hypothetical protein
MQGHSASAPAGAAAGATACAARLAFHTRRVHAPSENAWRRGTWRAQLQAARRAAAQQHAYATSRLLETEVSFLTAPAYPSPLAAVRQCSPLFSAPCRLFLQDSLYTKPRAVLYLHLQVKYSTVKAFRCFAYMLCCNYVQERGGEPLRRVRAAAERRRGE